MPDSEQHYTADIYQDASLSRVKSGCLKVFQSLGAFRDEIVLVGGLVPALIIDQTQFSETAGPAESHVGTLDVDIGFSFGIISEEAYDDVVDRLQGSDFERDLNDAGNPTNHRWVIGEGSSRVTVDFQIPEDKETPSPGHLQRLTGELSAIVTPGLDLAFQDSDVLEVSGRLPEGGRITRDIRICSPAGLVLLKGLAIGERDKWKDYYDIFYVLRNWENGREDVADQFVDLWQADEQGDVPTCFENLKRDFETMDHVGPRSVARFFFGEETVYRSSDGQKQDEQEQLMRQSQLIVDEFISACLTLRDEVL